jgi:hypothetical protein
MNALLFVIGVFLVMSILASVFNQCPDNYLGWCMNAGLVLNLALYVYLGYNLYKVQVNPYIPWRVL